MCCPVSVPVAVSCSPKARLPECHDWLAAGGLAGGAAGGARSNSLRVLLPLLTGTSDESGAQKQR